MPPELDIYALTRYRDRATIERFLDEYVDRAASEDREDEELMIERLTDDGEERASELDGEEKYEWEPARTLTHIIERGLDIPRRAFTVYLTARSADIDRVILCFTRDDQLVLGLAIEDEGGQPENEAKAKALLAMMMKRYRCHAGLILVEDYPPHDEREFHERATMYPLTISYVDDTQRES